MNAFADFEALSAGAADTASLAQLATAAPIKTRQERQADWLKQRWGKFTASEFHKLMAYEDKDELSKGGKTYARKKAVELMTEVEPEGFLSPAMQWGIDHEAEAVDAFMDATGFSVTHCKDAQEFIALGDSVGGTPDGLIDGFDAGLEIKCPNSDTHLDYLETVRDGATLKAAAPDYYWQCQGLMLVTGFTHWWFASYDPRYKSPGMRLHIAKIARDDDAIAKLQHRLDQAIDYRDALVARKDGGYDPKALARLSVAEAAKAHQSLQVQLAALAERLARLEAGSPPPAQTASPEAETPSPWTAAIDACQTISDIGRAARQMREDKTLDAATRDSLTRRLSARQEAIKAAIAQQLQAQAA